MHLTQVTLNHRVSKVRLALVGRIMSLCHRARKTVAMQGSGHPPLPRTYQRMQITRTIFLTQYDKDATKIGEKAEQYPSN